MPEHRLCFLILQVALFGRVSLATGNVSVSGCQGDSVELYSNITFNNNFTEVYVYKNGVDNLLIAAWTSQKSSFSSTTVNGYSDKFLLDKHGHIWIHGLVISDEAEYTIRINTEKESSYSVVQLNVLVAPTTNCKPKIKRLVNVLTVYLETTGCGRPAASVYWLNHSGIFHTDTKAIELQPGKQDGIYYACIKGDALQCIKSSQFSEYCEFLQVVDDQTSRNQEKKGMIPSLTPGFFMILLAALTLICITLCVVIYIIVIQKNKANGNREPVAEDKANGSSELVAEGALEDMSDNSVDEIYPMERLLDAASSLPLPIQELEQQSKREHEVEGTLPKVSETTRRGFAERSHNEHGWLKQNQ